MWSRALDIFIWVIAAAAIVIALAAVLRL